MKTRTKKALAIGAMAPAILVLTACRADMIVQINDDGTGTTIMEFEDTTGELSGFGFTCEDLFDEMGVEDPFDTDAEVIEDISGANLACRMTSTSTENLVDGETFIDNGDSFTLVAEADPTMSMEDLDMPPGTEFEFTMTIEMPGQIVEATNGGVVDGNRATYDLFEAMSTGFEVTGMKSGSGTGGGTGGGTTGSGGEEPGGGDDTGQGGEEPGQGSTDPDTPSNGGEEPGEGSDEGSDTGAAPGDGDGDELTDTTDATDSDDEGFPMWAWFAIGGGAIVIIGLVAWMITRGNKNKNQQGPYGPGGGGYGGGYPPQGGQYAGPTSAYGVPQAGQHNAPGGQFQGPQGGHYGQQPPQHNPNQGGQPPYNPNSGQ